MERDKWGLLMVYPNGLHRLQQVEYDVIGPFDTKKEAEAYRRQRYPHLVVIPIISPQQAAMIQDKRL